LKIKVVLRNPLRHRDTLDYHIQVQDHALAHDWVAALKALLQSKKPIEKNFCFLGFPKTARNLNYLCEQMNQAIDQINNGFQDYHIDQRFDEQLCTAPDLGPNQELFNTIHNHFEQLQGTVWNLSSYYQRADYETKYAIRQINNLCHEMESLILSRRQLVQAPDWVRPSQITTWLTADRYELKPEHRTGFLVNGYDRVLGGVYMHWTQIGKTLFEVWRDEGAPQLTETVCDAITELRYYSGEFDVEWGRDITDCSVQCAWHHNQIKRFKSWLVDNGKDPEDLNLSLGYLPLGQIDLLGSFGTTDHLKIWDTLSNYLDIYQIEVDGMCQTYDYCWTDSDHKLQQINQLRPGYDYQLRRWKNDMAD
jgi:hypothetical protein